MHAGMALSLAGTPITACNAHCCQLCLSEQTLACIRDKVCSLDDQSAAAKLFSHSLSPGLHGVLAFGMGHSDVRGFG